MRVGCVHHLDHLCEALAVLVKEPLLDVLEINLRAGDNDADERLVVRACALHRFVQPLGKVRRAILDAHHHSLWSVQWRRCSSD